MTEKMECIFDGLITVTAASNQTTTPEPNMPQGPLTAAQIEAAIAVVTGKEPEPKKERTKDELIIRDRQSDVKGKRVSVRVDLVVRLIITTYTKILLLNYQVS